MLIDDHNAEDLLVSVIAPFPKNWRSSLNTSDNYKEILLCCSLCQLIEIRFIDKYSRSSNLQLIAFAR